MRLYHLVLAIVLLAAGYAIGARYPSAVPYIGAS